MVKELRWLKNKMVKELKDNYFKDFEYKGLEINEESEERGLSPPREL